MFDDQAGNVDDLTQALRSFARNSPQAAKQEFDELQIVFEHEGPLIRSVIDSRIEMIHAADVDPIMLTVAGFLKEYRAENSLLDADRQELFDSIFADQAGYDAVTGAATDEFNKLVNEIKAAALRHIVVDAAKVGSTVRFIRTSSSETEKAPGWNELFQHPSITLDDVQYCYQWHRKCVENRIVMQDSELVDTQRRAEKWGDTGDQRAHQSTNSKAGENPFHGITLSGEDVPNTSWFGGPGQADIWQAVSHEIGGRFEKGGLFSRHAVMGQWGSHVIRLEDQSSSDDNGTTYRVRMQAGVTRRRSSVICRVHEEGIFGTLGKMMFKTQDVEIGDPEFDRRYIVKGNNERGIRDLYARQHIRQLIMLLPDVVVSVGTKSVRLESSCTH
ncbi:MAG: hypothetical protein ABGZ17_23010, partial [Planctomycetaceae bacterium]